MAVPVITHQAAFGSNPTDASYSWTTIHDGAIGSVRAFGYQRGRQNELNRIETGTGNLTISDPESDWDSDNTGSVYYPDARAYVPIRARAIINSNTYPLFQHYLERKPRSLRVRTTYTERHLTTVDGFEWLARAGISGESYSQELSGARITNVLDDVFWPAALRDLDTGNETVGALTVAADEELKALEHLLDVIDTENGLLFVDAQGRVSFVQRHALIQTPYTTSQATFCDATSGGGFEVTNLVPADDLDTTFNEWSGTRDGGTTQTATDTASRALNGLRSKQVTSLAVSDTVVLNQMQWKLAVFKDPLSRIASITVMPQTDTACWEAVLGLEIGERITVRETPPGWGSVKQDDYTIQRISAAFPVGPVSQAQFTFELWPAAETSGWWIAGDASNSLAGLTTRAAY